MICEVPVDDPYQQISFQIEAHLKKFYPIRNKNAFDMIYNDI